MANYQTMSEEKISVKAYVLCKEYDKKDRYY